MLLGIPYISIAVVCRVASSVDVTASAATQNYKSARRTRVLETASVFIFNSQMIMLGREMCE